MSQSFSLSLSNENAMTHFICSLYLFRISELILSSAGQLTSQCLSQPISQSVSRPASQLANLSVYQLVSQQAKESDNHTANYSVSHEVSQSICSDKGLPPESTALKFFTVANLRYQLSL